MISKKNLLIIIPILLLVGIATLIMLNSVNSNEALIDDKGCSSCSGPKAFKAKNKSNEI